ncbi:hypothetical protein GCM10009019_09360 [Salarchaeum japonicum]|uniref:Uncharacterized protein n=2 Tax=Salarchaeum japonicum TaxID=555573 RepID=A0AAV3SZ35_9EURY
MDVAASERRIRETLVSNHLSGYWNIVPQVVQSRTENNSIFDFFANFVRRHPSGWTNFELHIEQSTDGVWSREGFKELCEELGVDASFRVRENGPPVVVDLTVQSTDPHTVVDFVRGLAEEVPQDVLGEREREVEVSIGET